MVTVTTTGATHDGRGVARIDGRVMFIEGALPGERVDAEVVRRRRGHDEARVTAVLESSPQRVTPRCVHFGTCGGCVMQHADGALQRQLKQQALADNLERLAGVAPARWLHPIVGPEWRYRRRARLSVRYEEQEARVRIGFRERGRKEVADLTTCEILVDPVARLLAPLSALFSMLHAARAIPQVEVAAGDTVTVLLLRHLEPLDTHDRGLLRAFAQDHGVVFQLQGGGYDSIESLIEPAPELEYALPESEIILRFAANDFIQVNAKVNQGLVSAALSAMAPEPDERYLDLFCGLGNFTLPLARQAGEVIAVEGEEGLVARARANAVANAIENVQFHIADLNQPVPDARWAQGRFHGVLLDPPRNGARAALPMLASWAPERIVYVSCHPGTLARDTKDIVERYGYRLAAAGIADMFPHTAHVESIAVFER